MILDTSVVIAILRQEPEAAQFAALIERAPRPALSTATALEATLVVGRAGARDLDDLMSAIDPEYLAVDSRHLTAARLGWVRYGRGSGSRAQLNFGDCFSYAAAVVEGEPLLFKGDDFVHTDVLDARG